MYGIIFWDNLFNGKKIFILQKKTVRIRWILNLEIYVEAHLKD
jgi:hypothetical protein